MLVGRAFQVEAPENIKLRLNRSILVNGRIQFDEWYRAVTFLTAEFR